MKRKLLVAVDGTKNSLRTALYATGAYSGGETGVRIVLFHVLPRLPPHVESSRAAVAEKRAKVFGEKALLKAERMLARIKERMVRAGAAPQSVSVDIVEKVAMFRPRSWRLRLSIAATPSSSAATKNR